MKEMTNDELERAIDFLLKSRANLEAQAARTDEQFKQLVERLDSFADTQANIMRVMTRTFEAQTQIDESLRSAVIELANRQSRTEDSLLRLAEAQANSDRRLDALMKIVGERYGQQ
jgi:chaperonin cofactor prefoldin